MYNSSRYPCYPCSDTQSEPQSGNNTRFKSFKAKRHMGVVTSPAHSAPILYIILYSPISLSYLRVLALKPNQTKQAQINQTANPKD